MTKKEVLNYWLTTAQDDLETAETLIKAKKYHHALFFSHLALEKLIKGLVYKNTNNHPLPIHNLKRLATQAKLPFTVQQALDMKEMTSWNIEARYDDIKRKFYKKAAKEFTLRWWQKVKGLFQWLKNQY